MWQNSDAIKFDGLPNTNKRSEYMKSGHDDFGGDENSTLMLCVKNIHRVVDYTKNLLKIYENENFGKQIHTIIFCWK